MSSSIKAIIAPLEPYAQLGRIFGSLLTASCALIGYLSGAPDLEQAFGNLGAARLTALILVAILAHIVGATCNELAGMQEDASVPELKRKPLVSGRVSQRAAWIYAGIAGLASISISYMVLGLRPTIPLILGIGIGAYYNFWGKYTAWAYEGSLGLGIATGMMVGAFSGGGITPLFMITASIVFLEVTFCQWLGGIKDVETDRRQGIPTRAVIWGYTLERRLRLTEANFVLAIGLKGAIVCCYLIPLLAPEHFAMSTIYQRLALWVAAPTQGVTLLLLLLGKTRLWFTRIIVFDLAITWLMAPLLVYGGLGSIGTPVFYLAPVVWALGWNRLLYGKAWSPGL